MIGELVRWPSGKAFRGEPLGTPCGVAEVQPLPLPPSLFSLYGRFAALPPIVARDWFAHATNYRRSEV